MGEGGGVRPRSDVVIRGRVWRARQLAVECAGMAVVESLWARGKAASVSVYVPCEGERRGTVKTAAYLI